MSISVWDVFHNAIFRQCDPYIAGGATSMDATVRWVYTNERYDVTQFLSGGELLIIEGNALSQHQDNEGLRRYVDSLVQAHVSGLAIELVDFFDEMPQYLAQCGDELGLPIIGLRKRLPFVALCQEINTLIAREQMLSHMSVDDTAHSLDTRLFQATSLSDVATAVSQTFGENVLIITADGRSTARSGIGEGTDHDTSQELRQAQHHQGHDLALPIRRNGSAVATVVISQNMALLNEAVVRHAETRLTQTLPSLVNLSVRAKMTMQVLGGARDEICASVQEVQDAASILVALGLRPDAHGFPFILDVRDWTHHASEYAQMLRQLNAQARQHNLTLLSTIEATRMIGSFMCDEAPRLNSLSTRSMAMLNGLLVNDRIRIIEGGETIGARGLLHGISSVRFATEQRPMHWGTMISADNFAFRKLLSVNETPSAARAFVSLYADVLNEVDDTTIDTLCALGDCLGNRTLTCQRLGITRQTLYNRLARISQTTTVSQENTDVWALMVIAAKFVRETRSIASA